MVQFPTSTTTLSFFPPHFPPSLGQEIQRNNGGSSSWRFGIIKNWASNHHHIVLFFFFIIITRASSTIQPSSPLCLARLCSRSVPQALHHLMLRYKEKRWDSKRMLDSGGMPSSHSATVTALAVAVGLQEGTGSPAFAIVVVLACVVMYDASGVRLHAGRQAELLNQIVCEFPPEHPLSSSRPLRELLGHTPLQVVAGAILGCIVGYLMRNTD
ncbi:uncharacterized protein LOC133681601 isoform X1 [Populus nigra]|nr:uncharacterized protein LOC133681601 isoform X1 [Populus nigra]